MKKDVPWDDLSDRHVSPDWGRQTLDRLGDGDWEHGETEHFVVHYTAKAAKIARLAEESYAEIFAFFGNPKDQLVGRKSHIYAIHDRGDWERFKKEIAGLPWIGAVCRGHEFWFPSQDHNGDFDIKGETLNHEMTHLVFNRMLGHRIPLWLNEGIAEYFGARRILGKTGFRQKVRGSNPVPLKTLLAMTAYPSDQAAIHAFYREASILVDYLTDNHDPALLRALVEQCTPKADAASLLPRIYGFDSLEAFDAEYQKHRRRYQ